MDWSRGSEWKGKTKGRTCSGESEAMSGSIYPRGWPPEARIVDQVLTKLSKPVSLLNITTLSQLRKDGHPSVYGFEGVKGNDCSHWCLAGVPDTWNELFYSLTLLSTQS